MGAAALVRSSKKDVVREEDLKDDKSLVYIPLNKITENIKVYQHCDNGQVLVLLYQTLEDVLKNGDVENWAECQVSSMQKSYTSNIKAYVHVDKSPENSLLDYHGVNDHSRLSINSLRSDGNRDSFLSHKSRDSFFSQRDSILSISSSLGDLDRPIKLALSPSELAYDMLGSISPNKKSPEAKADGVELPDKFNQPYNRVVYLPPNYSIPNDELKLSTNKKEISEFIQKFESSKSAKVAIDNLIAKTEISAENNDIVFDNFTNAIVCRRCGGVLDHSKSENISLKEVKDHIFKCSATEELRQLFVEVDDNLRPFLLEYKDNNSTLMYATLGDAIARFEAINQRSNIVYHLLRRVVYIHSTSADGKKLQSLQKEIEDAINNFKDEYNATESTITKDMLSRHLEVLGNCFVHIKSKRTMLQQHNRVLMTINDFKLVKPIGKGFFSTVYLAKRKSDDSVVAIKVMNKNLIREHNMAHQVMKERSIAFNAGKDNAIFVKGFCSFQTNSYLCLVSEYIHGGDCLTLIQAFKRLDEVVARHIIAEVALGIFHLHIHGIMHRDIKPNNILITSKGHIKITDFGFSSNITKRPQSISYLKSAGNYVSTPWYNSDNVYDSSGISSVMGSSDSYSSVHFRKGSNTTNTPHGNPLYSCPEIIVGGAYDHTIDWWALGVMHFHLLTGETPFHDTTDENVLDNVVMNRINWKCFPSSVSSIGKDFIKALLRPNNKDRLGYCSPQQVLEHVYFRGFENNWKEIFNLPSPLLLYIEGELDSKYHSCNDISGETETAFSDIELEEDNRIDADLDFSDFSLNNF